MKTIINVECMDQELVITNSPVIASGGVHENFIAFNFCEKWDGLGKTAVFFRNEKERFYSVLGPDDVCEIPHEVTDYEGNMYFGVYGEAGDVTKTSKVLKYKIIQGAMTTLLKPSEEPTPDIYQQLLSAYGQTNEAIARESAEREASMVAEQSARNSAINTAILAEENARKQADATEKAERQAEIAVERARINQFTRMEEGSTTGDVELMDIRVGADGQTHESAGEAVRSQYVALNTKIDDNVGQLSSEIVDLENYNKNTVSQLTTPLEEVEEVSTTSQPNWYWDIQTGKVVGTPFTGNYTAIEPISVNPFERYFIKVHGGVSPKQRCIVVADDNDNVIYSYDALDDIAWVETDLIIPISGSKLYINRYQDTVLTVKKYSMSKSYALSDDVVKIDELLKKGYLVKEFDWSLLGTGVHQYGWMGGYYNEETGEPHSAVVHMRSLNENIVFGDNVIYFDFTPPTGYRGMVSVYNNSDNTYIGKIGDVIDGEFGAIRIINNPNYGYKFTVGRFNDSTGETKSLDKDFVDTIKLEYMVNEGKIIVSDSSNLKVSIMSDSISSYDGYVPSGNKVYYPRHDINNASQMWWSVMNSILNTELLVNNSWSGSCCASGVRTDTTEASSDSRCGNLGDNPDIILSCIGGNDYSYDCPIGDWNGTTKPTDTTTFREAYAVMLNKMQTNYPNSLIVCVAPWYLQRGTDNGVTYTNNLGLTESDYAKAIKEVADIFRLPFIDIANLCGFNRYNYYPTFCVDSDTSPTHPNALGHKVIGETMAQEIVKICNGYFNYLH